MKLERQGEDYVLRVSRDELGYTYGALLVGSHLIADSEYQTITGHEKTDVEQFFLQFREQWAAAGGLAWNTEVWLQELRDALELLAAPPEAQLAYARRIGMTLDDLALTEHVRIHAIALHADGVLGSRQMEAAIAVDQWRREMGELPQNRSFPEEALRTAAWDEMRDLAAKALSLLDPSERQGEDTLH